MKLDYEPNVSEIVEVANRQTNNKFDIHNLKAIGKPEFKSKILDNPFIYYIPGFLPQDNGVLMISPKKHPRVVEQAVKKTRLARNILLNSLADVILEPIIEGSCQGLSYAIWPEQKPISHFKLMRAFQKRWLNSRVFTWLTQIAIDSTNQQSSTINRQYFRSFFEEVANESMQSDTIRAYAMEGLSYMDKEEWLPVTVLQHSDFWLGNILLAKNIDNKFGFYVIDWGGFLTDGTPFIDLITYCISAGITPKRARQEFDKYAQASQIPLEESVYYLIIALGRLGMNLQQFPKNRYIEMCTRTFNFLEAMKLVDNQIVNKLNRNKSYFEVKSSLCKN